MGSEMCIRDSITTRTSTSKTSRLIPCRKSTPCGNILQRRVLPLHADMKEGQMSLVFAKPEYSFEAPCCMARPSQLPDDAATETEIILLRVADGSNVRLSEYRTVPSNAYILCPLA